MLLESITQLCSSRKCREFIRDKNTYVILRELHKWEKDKKALLACENLVDILIRLVINLTIMYLCILFIKLCYVNTALKKK